MENGVCDEHLSKESHMKHKGLMKILPGCGLQKHKGLMEILPGCGLQLRKSRLEFLSMIMVAVVQARTVNLASITGMMEGQAQAASLYRRAQRFFCELKLVDEVVLGCAQALHLLRSYSLCIDRTNWKLGKLNIIRSVHQ
jgi:hypothetical protein